jgi:hypothetical protein
LRPARCSERRDARRRAALNHRNRHRDGVYSLSRPALDALARSDPGLATKLLVNLGRHLSARLRQTTDTLRELVDSRG